MADGRRHAPKRPPNLPLALPATFDREEIAWAGGLFDGEGCVLAVRGRSNRRYPVLTVSQSGRAEAPPALLPRFRDAVGTIGQIDGPQIVPRRRPKWVYRASGFEAVQVVVALLWADLGPVKRLQARRALTAYLSRAPAPRREGVRYGRPLRIAVRLIEK